MNYLEKYRTHQSVEEMNISVNNHISKLKLTGNLKKVLKCMSGHSRTYFGACHLKAETIANELDISRSTVTRCIKKLKESQVINVYNNVKLNGIKGANIYTIIFLSHGEPTIEPSEMSQRVIHEKPTVSTVEATKNETESLSLNLYSNYFVNAVVSNVTTHATKKDLKTTLKEIYKPKSQLDYEKFEQLCKIGFGRLKQLVHSHQIPYLQMEEIVIRCMQQLIRKTDVHNEFAMYSKMIERQALQLFEPYICSKQVQIKSKDIKPEWFDDRNKEVPKEILGEDAILKAKAKIAALSL